MQRNVAEKKILASNWGLKKNSCTEKLPNPPLKYLMVRPLYAGSYCSEAALSTRVNIEKIDNLSNLFQVDINRREQGCAAHYEQYCQHVVTALFNCNKLEQHG